MRNNDDVDEGTLQKWDDRYVHQLIVAYDHHKHPFMSSRGKVSKKQVFERIAEYFNVTVDVTVTGRSMSSQVDRTRTKICRSRG